MTNPTNPRQLALKLLIAVVRDGQSTGATLPAAQNACQARDRGLLQQLIMGSLQHWFGLQAELSDYLQKPLKAKDIDIQCLLSLGLFQLRHTRIPAHAAISETVNLCPKNKKWARGLCNAVLRRASKIEAAADNVIELPLWLATKIKQDWPSEAVTIFDGSKINTGMTLRAVIERQVLADKLSSQGLNTSPHPVIASALWANEPRDITELQSFKDGEFVVQDAAAQIAASLLTPLDSDTILDACAAPGGKTTHLLQLAPRATVVALDAEASRLERVHQNLTRLQLNAEVIAGDAREPGKWASARQFDRILLDAPCSASGVIRRHPDIKLLRRESDIARLVALQKSILKALWPTLKAGGRMLYCTCSVLKDENVKQMQAFIASHADATVVPINSEWGRPCELGKQIFPGDSGMDGFYYCLLEKQKSA